MPLTKIKGVNLGSWLMMEGYILGGRNIPEKRFKYGFKKIHGQKQLEEFESIFRDNFIQEDDFKNISDMGANTVRVPFNCRLLSPKPNKFDSRGFSYLERALNWADKYNLKIILDLHAAFGSQNYDWHSDSDGETLFWENLRYQEAILKLWQEIAISFKDKKALLGYDVINEPVLDKNKVDLIKNFYSKAIKTIRAIDKDHLIFIEGNTWGQDIDFLSGILEEGVSVSIHCYLPLNYTFNFIYFNKYPGVIDNQLWDKNKVREYLAPYKLFSEKYNTKIYVGEFGINWRGGFFGEIEYLKDMIQTFEDSNFGYTYWTYKAVAQSNFPDGIYQFINNSKYVSREGPIYGWENYTRFWKTEKDQIRCFLNTKNFTPNKEIISVLNRFFVA